MADTREATGLRCVGCSPRGVLDAFFHQPLPVVNQDKRNDARAWRRRAMDKEKTA